MEMKSFKPGEFCWAELATSDWKAAKQFYGSLFGWTTDERPMGPDQPPYVMLQIKGKNAGALYENKQARPAWTSYISVAKADDTAKKAKSAGAKLLQEPFDVMDVGRMATVQDPQGAKFAIWEAKLHEGFEVVGEPGAVCWNELSTNDIDSARKFYGAVFPQWKLKVTPQYSEIHVGDNGIGGIHDMAKEMPPFWMPYFQVTDCDASTKKAKSLGSNIWVEPKDIPDVGRFSMFGDPQGAALAVIQLRPR